MRIVTKYCAKCKSLTKTDRVCINPDSPHYKKERDNFDTCEKHQKEL